MHAAITEESIAKANALFWEQMLAIRMTHLSGALDGQHAAHSIGKEHVMGRCDISGEWNGWIEVRLSDKLARTATSAMLMQPIDAIDATDVFDAVKEITNMIAGTIKSALPRPCSMTVPTAVTEIKDFYPPSDGGACVCALFQHSDGKLLVCVRADTKTS